jgi:peptidoglycan/xylan/chitin deacetylase (PgdA/CDA1 family)
MLAATGSVVRNAAKMVVFAAMGNGPWLRRRLEMLGKRGGATILNLHRVADDDGSDYRPLSPDLFDQLLAFVSREFAVMTIGELGEKTTRPKLVLSFDDGYRDFLTTAVPILKRYGLRASQNVIPHCIESGLPPLNVMAQDFVGQAPKAVVRELNIDGFSAPLDHRFGHRLSHFLKMRSQAEQDAIAKDLLPQFYRWDGFKPTAMMTLDEVRSLDAHELGAHSFAHSSMEFESDDFLDADVARCAGYFREKLNAPMSIYAFPNGSCRKGQAERVLSHGVDHVLLVGERYDRGDRIHHRISFDARSPSEVRVRAVGGRAQA